MSRYKITIQYDGNSFSGFQSQKNKSGIQNQIESSIAKLNNNKLVKVYGASRTDAGVHALGQVAHFDIVSQLSDDDFLRAINARLNKEIENSFIGKYPKNKPTRYDNIKVSKISPQITLEHREIEQVHIHIGYHGVSRSHPDRYALAMLSLILGDGMSSRLFQEIRERRGLVYDIESGTSHLQDVGDFRITLAVHRDKYVEAIKSILEEIEAVKRDLGNPEVTRAKQIMSGRRRLRMDNTCLLYTSPSPRDATLSRMPSSA